MPNFEVEQKFHVDDLGEIERRLLELGAIAAEDVWQVDRYFNHPARDFASTDEALRIRSVGETNFLTFKGPRQAAAVKTREEIELPLGDSQGVAEQMASVLESLSFQPVATVRKRRREMRLSWREAKFNCALDEVEGVGRFVELELLADTTGLTAAQEKIAALAERLQLSRVENSSYLALLLAGNDSAR